MAFTDPKGNVFHYCELVGVSEIEEVEGEYYSGARFTLGLACEDGEERISYLELDAENTGAAPIRGGKKKTFNKFWCTANNLFAVLKPDAYARLVGTKAMSALDESAEDYADKAVALCLSVPPDKLRSLTPEDFDLGKNLNGKQCVDMSGKLGTRIKWLNTPKQKPVVWGKRISGKGAIRQPPVSDDVKLIDESEVF
jgi:hypothetical protein